MQVPWILPVLFVIVYKNPASATPCRQMDIVIALDSSGSVGMINWKKTLQFAQALISNFEIGPHATQIGVISFDHTATVIFHLNDYTDKTIINDVISAMPYTSGGTDASEGIYVMHNTLFTTVNGARRNVIRYGIIFTDGFSDVETSERESNVARSKGIIMMAVGVGPTTSQPQLQAIANDPDENYMFNVEGYDALNTMSSRLSFGACEASLGMMFIGEECSTATICLNHAQCLDDGTGIHRCMCKPGDIVCEYAGTSMCGLIITSATHPECELCEINGGTCYDVNDDSQKDGCVCPSFKSGTDCAITLVDGFVGEMCTASTRCIKNGECSHDGGNGDITRCLCKADYVAAESDGGLMCAAMITSDIDSNCQHCEFNGGICYDLDDDQKRDGCVCPSYRSGADCVQSHVDVACNLENFTMTICYAEHDAYVEGGAVLLVEGKAMTKACHAVPAVSGDSYCSPGQHRLVLPLMEPRRFICGTYKFLSDITIMTYRTNLIVQHQLMNVDQDDVSFSVSCSFDTHANLFLSEIGLKTVTYHGKEGDHRKPTLLLTVENAVGDTIPDGVALRLGDRVRFRMLLYDDGAYAAIRILRCISSTSSVVPDANAVTLPLITGSCPHSGQNHITNINNWHRVPRKTNELQTGLVRMFKMSEGRSVHFHCSVKLCLKGAEADCAEVQCLNSSATSYSRRKRSNDPTVSQVVSRTLQWYEPRVTSQRIEANPFGTLEIFCVVLGIVTLTVFIGLSTLIVFNLHCSTTVRHITDPCG